MDAIFGKTETITIDVYEQCDECMGSGARSKSDVKSCSRCGGTGTVTQQQRTPFGVFQSQTVCPDCNGTGKTIAHKCPKCHGKGYEHKRVKLDIKIPAGIQSCQQVRVPNKGERGVNGGPNGDLYIEILVTRHNQFVRDGNDIRISVPISAIDATLGCKIDVPTVYGDVELTIPAGTQYGWCVRFPNPPPPHWAFWGWGCFCCAAAGIERPPGSCSPCFPSDSGPGERRIKNPGTAERNAIPGREIAGNSVIRRISPAASGLPWRPGPPGPV